MLSTYGLILSSYVPDYFKAAKWDDLYDNITLNEIKISEEDEPETRKRVRIKS